MMQRTTKKSNFTIKSCNNFNQILIAVLNCLQKNVLYFLDDPCTYECWGSQENTIFLKG